MPRRLGSAALGVSLGVALLAPVTWSPPAANAAVPPDPNPPIEQSCGLELTLVLDASGSVSSSNAVEDVRAAGDALLSALTNTNSTARVTQFASLSRGACASHPDRRHVDGQRWCPRRGPAGLLQPDPAAPGQREHLLLPGQRQSPARAAASTAANSSNQYTNWDQSLEPGRHRRRRAAGLRDRRRSHRRTTSTSPATPSAPRTSRSDTTGAGQPADHGSRRRRRPTRSRTASSPATPRRPRVSGVGSALNNTDSRNRLVQISGPQVVRDADLADVDEPERDRRRPGDRLRGPRRVHAQPRAAAVLAVADDPQARADRRRRDVRARRQDGTSR